MEKALIFKEWVKTRMVFFISLAFAVSITLYSVLMMKRLIELKGVEHLWLIMLLKDNTFVDMIKYVPVIAGIAVGIAQMTPEMTGKRLKLTLHLPYPQGRLIALMLLTGFVEILVIYFLQAGVIVAFDASILPSELVLRVMLTVLPWFFAGFFAYFFVSAICLEGTLRRRVILALVGIALLMVCFVQPAPEAYNGMLVLLAVVTLLLPLLSLGSVIRFKEGRQD